ncbi:MAG: hypothetical protein RIR76_513 [Verrucomicrobiota bacterium]
MSVDKLEGRVSPKGIGGGYSQFSIQNLEKLGSFLTGSNAIQFTMS